MFKKLFLLLLFLIITSPVLAGDLPKGVKPEQGKASGTLGIGDEQLTVTIDFWNVGEIGGSEYGEASVDIGCTQKTIGDWKCTADDNPPQTGSFSGGPNGKIIINGNTIQLVNGNKFTSDMEKTFQATVENPEIFSKYRWNMDESAEESKLEDSGVRFSDLSGQVEVLIPLPDGSYDEEAWNLAKLDMVLPVGTRIRTEEDTQVILSFPDMTTFTMGSETQVMLSSPKSQDTALKLLWGNLMVNVKKMMKDGSMEVEMSQAVAGIKGTIFTLEETKDKSTIKVIEGAVSFTSKISGKIEMVNSGEALTADTNGLGQKTTFDPTEEEKQWQELADGIKKTNPNILGSKNTFYILGGIIISAIIIGFLLLKVRKTK